MSDTDEINVCSLDDLKIAVKTWPNDKLGRILRVVATEGHRRFVETEKIWLAMCEDEKAELDGLQAEIDADQAAKGKEDA